MNIQQHQHPGTSLITIRCLLSMFDTAGCCTVSTMQNQPDLHLITINLSEVLRMKCSGPKLIGLLTARRGLITGAWVLLIWAV